MRKFGLIVVGVCLTATMALGTDGEPAKAGGFKSDLVNAYPACTVLTELTLGIALPACPAVDPALCTFGVKGKGKVSAKAKDDVKLQASLSGLENCVDGTTLFLTAEIAAATNNCSVSSRCNTITIPGFPLGSCTVASGKCKLKTTVNTLIPGAVTPGENTAITVTGVGVGTGTSAVAAAGVLVP
jgi:hypothetical protein